jgi:hypothetical protein
MNAWPDCPKHRRVLGGVKASTPQAARTLLDPACDSRHSPKQVGAEEWSFGLTEECRFNHHRQHAPMTGMI